MISAQGIATDEGKIEAIKKWPIPTNITEVQSFLEFTGYYRKFIPKFVQVAQPLHELAWDENAGKKKAAIKWDNRCQQAFDDLKGLCTTTPILAYVDFTQPFKHQSDACGSGLGAVLYQTHEDGMDTVIAYASRCLTKAESHDPVHKLEFLAHKWAVVEKFHKYLYGFTFQHLCWQLPLNLHPHDCQMRCSQLLVGGQLGRLQLPVILLSRKDQYQCRCLIKGVLAGVHA